MSWDFSSVSSFSIHPFPQKETMQRVGVQQMSFQWFWLQGTRLRISHRHSKTGMAGHAMHWPCSPSIHQSLVNFSTNSRSTVCGCLWAWGLLVASFRTKGVTQYRLKKIQTKQEEKRKIFSPFKGQFDLICHGLLSMASGAFAHVHRDHQTRQVMRFYGDCCAEGKNQRELGHDIQLKVRSS